MDYQIDKTHQTIAIKVPLEAEKIEIYKFDKYFHFKYHVGNTQTGWAFLFSNFGGKKQYPTKIELAGFELEADHKVIHYSYERN